MENSEFDINKVISDLLTENSKSMVNSMIGFGKKSYESILAIFESCFQDYLKLSYEKYSKIKTILYRDKPVPISKFYVATDVQIGSKKLSTDDIAPLFKDSMKQVFVGTAGCGKSTLLKYFFTKLVENKNQGIPVFVELRYINISPDKSLLDVIFALLSDANKKLTNEQFQYALNAGKLILILDGFDEVDHKIRMRVVKDILHISTSYPNTRLIISSRPDDTFDSWQEFSTYHVLALSKDQASELVSKLDYDIEIKTHFLKELQGGLYERHTDFLSNPLLLTMMLLTYEQIAEIPAKMHIFYNQAFEILFNKHDALKTLYKRQSYTSMPIDDFKRVLSAFSITSYSRGHLYFNRDLINVFLDDSKKLTGIDFDNERFFKDLLESVCILNKDGLNYTYTHRSFQEYFSACFLSRFDSPKRKPLLQKMLRLGSRENVLRLLFEMNPEAVELDLIIPALKDAVSKAESVKPGIYKYARILDQWYAGLSVIHQDDRIGYRLDDKRPFPFLRMLIRGRYPEFEKVKTPQSLPRKVSKETRVKIIDELFDKKKVGSIPFVPIDKVKHNAFLVLGCKDYLEQELSKARRVLEHLETKYLNRSEDIDALLFK